MRLCCINKIPTKSNLWPGTVDGGVKPSQSYSFWIFFYFFVRSLSLCLKPMAFICQHAHLSLSGLLLHVRDHRWMDDRLHSPLSIHLRNDRISPCMMEGWMDGWKTDESAQSIFGTILGNLHWFYSSIAPPSGCTVMIKKGCHLPPNPRSNCYWCCIKPEAFSR